MENVKTCICETCGGLGSIPTYPPCTFILCPSCGGTGRTCSEEDQHDD